MQHQDNTVCHSREMEHPPVVERESTDSPYYWIPAFAGMTRRIGQFDLLLLAYLDPAHRQLAAEDGQAKIRAIAPVHESALRQVEGRRLPLAAVAYLDVALWPKRPLVNAFGRIRAVVLHKERRAPRIAICHRKHDRFVIQFKRKGIIDIEVQVPPARRQFGIRRRGYR